MASLRELVKEMEAGAVELLVILGGNPVYTAPADLDFAEAVRKVPRAIHLGLYEDETSALCRWHLPEAHDSSPGAMPGRSTARCRSCSR